uniref:Uncharacterized protein n=1 Tax=viral metagenome TaxID=1070528 RepID=A0A6C0CFT6_9ZZZZ
MGSRLSNTSWCWSPRSRIPDHDPHPEIKSYDQRWKEQDEEDAEEQLFNDWWKENRWKYVKAKEYDHTDNDENS